MDKVLDFEMEQLLSTYRRELGLSLQETARRAGIPAPHLSAWEHGYKRLQPVQLLTLCDVLYGRSLELQRLIPAGQEQVKELRARVAVSA